MQTGGITECSTTWLAIGSTADTLPCLIQGLLAALCLCITTWATILIWPTAREGSTVASRSQPGTFSQLIGKGSRRHPVVMVAVCVFNPSTPFCPAESKFKNSSPWPSDETQLLLLYSFIHGQHDRKDMGYLANQMVCTGFGAMVCLNSAILRNSQEKDVPLREYRHLNLCQEDLSQRGE